MSNVFADAYYFVARLNRNDPDYHRVVQFEQQLRLTCSPKTGQ